MSNSQIFQSKLSDSLRVSNSPRSLVNSKLGDDDWAKIPRHFGVAAMSTRELRFANHKIGSFGMMTLPNLEEGALPMVENLTLASNKIGDPGMQALADAIRKGVLPKLRVVNLAGNPASTESKAAVLRALRERFPVSTEPRFKYTHRPLQVGPPWDKKKKAGDGH